MSEFQPEDIESLIAAELAGLPRLGRSTDPLGSHAVDWRHLPPDRVRAEWTALREWVEWFTVRYTVPVSVVPNCWWKHGALVEELSALHVAHLAAFDESDSGFGPVGWHERLALARPRLQNAGAGCASGHFELKSRSWDTATDEPEWDAWITQSHAGRDTVVPHEGKEEG
ncbi:hypothetical protein [Microbacterium rhizophilus]|uniref:hypothetical protein n=1 Tax=Microbacterium rhizophilus TaxID=3138934 RepID=UPI0031EE1CF1